MRGYTCFAAAGLLSCSALAVAGVDELIINELDADTPGTDTMEFIELYDGGTGTTSLDGHVVVFYNGSNDSSYAAFDLDGFSTDGNGYFLLANEAVPGVDLSFPNNFLQNGADGVALYLGNAEDFPSGTEVTTVNLLDAIVYGTNDPDAVGLLVLLNPDQPQVNESAGGNSSLDSNQRCPNGSGGRRNTDTYAQRGPTPKADNFCPLPFGACCDETSGLCEDGVSLEECDATGGRYGGDGSECATLDPPCVPLGACCDETTGACSEGVSQEECEAAGNRYGGNGSDCATIDPPCEAGVLAANLMITEVVDGTLDGAQPRWVEITNCSAETVDLSLYSFGNFNNGSTELGGGAATQLIGILLPGEVFVYAYDSEPTPPEISTFEVVYGFPPDQYAGGGFINGDDVLALFFGQAVGDGTNATIVDVYGVIGVDGSGEVWEYIDGYSNRNPGYTATDIFDPSQWFFGGPNSLEDPGGDEVEIEIIRELTNPGEHDCTGAVLISEIVDGTLPFGQPKWVEVTNCGDTDVDLSSYGIGNYNNGSTDLGGGASSALLGILPAGHSYIFSYEAPPEPPAISTFEDVYGFPPDQFAGGGFVNGDDVIALFFGQATGDGTDALLVDVYGVIGEDGSGTVWEYTDSYTRRVRGSGPSPVFAPAEWFIPGANALEADDDIEERQRLLKLTFPGVHACEETCIYDIDGSGIVGFGDLLFILSNWGVPGGPGDLNGDGVVGFDDLLLVLSFWGPC